MDGALGHGTHVGGIVHVVAPEAKLLPVRVLDSDGVGNAFDVSMGLVAATLRGASIVNLSLRLSDPSRAVETALDFADRNRVLVVAPAGNGGVAEVPSPAAHPIVIAVAGVDAADRKAAFSNFGAEVDLAAPSVGIVSTYAGGSYAAWSGTSMAAPFVTGTAALLCGSGSSDPREIRSWLTSAATSLESSEPTYAWGLGSGRLDAFESTLLAYRMEVEGKPTPSQIGF